MTGGYETAVVAVNSKIGRLLFRSETWDLRLTQPPLQEGQILRLTLRRAMLNSERARKP